MSRLDMPFWWERAFPREHLALLKYIQADPNNWQGRLVHQLVDNPKALPPELQLLGSRLGARIINPHPRYVEGDGVTITSYGSRSPGTVRQVVGNEVHVTSDYYVRVVGNGGDGRTLYVPSSSGNGTFIFTERKDHTFRLKAARNTFLQFGRSQR